MANHRCDQKQLLKAEGTSLQSHRKGVMQTSSGALHLRVLTESSTSPSVEVYQSALDKSHPLQRPLFLKLAVQTKPSMFRADGTLRNLESSPSRAGPPAMTAGFLACVITQPGWRSSPARLPELLPTRSTQEPDDGSLQGRRHLSFWEAKAFEGCSGRLWWWPMVAGRAAMGRIDDPERRGLEAALVRPEVSSQRIEKGKLAPGSKSSFARAASIHHAFSPVTYPTFHSTTPSSSSHCAFCSIAPCILEPALFLERSHTVFL